ncbi:MAG: carbohydrate binding domain-containing protein [Planctomycetia bacterium]|nr:carbohydrate binding domain-containing protein [Planctomycetia bacterium]
MRRVLSFLPIFVVCVLCLSVSNARAADVGELPKSAELFPFFIMGDDLPKVWTAPDSQKVAGDAGQVHVRDGKFYAGDAPIRFWGVNTCFSMNFPDKDDAVQYAKRMAKFGVNAVRLHHMDMRDIWGKNISRTQTEIDPEQLDKLDWLIYQFKQNGIYVNINLHVSRKLDEKDGFVGYDQRPSHDKGVDNFEPRMIELQKKYAKDLLAHVNPYTKMSYLEDPCIAMIEINNENSVAASWFWGNLDNLPAPYEAELQKQWNAWLAKKYRSTADIREAWGCKIFPVEEELALDGSFDDPKTLENNKNWVIENDGISKGRQEITPEGTLKISVETMGRNPWNPQIYLAKAPVKGGVPYTLSFRVRAKEACKLRCGVSENHAEWRNLGMSREFDVATEWKTYTFSFTCSADDQNARVSFSGFKAGGVYEFDDISFRAGGVVGIAQNEKLEDASIQIIYRNKDSHRATKNAKRDFAFFILDLEDRYWQEMYNYVKKELKAKAPVSGTQLQYGAHYAQAKLDYCDIHAYWNHPSFPGRPWDGGNWKLGNTAEVNVLGRSYSCATHLANNRVYGKPYTVSEYNHPYPNLYGAEGFPILSSVAAFQEWDGIFIFAWSHTKEFSPNSTPSFFDIWGNPIQLAHMAACYNMFVRGDVQSGFDLAGEQIVYELGYEQEREIHAAATNGYHRSLQSIGFVNDLPLRKVVGIRTTDLPVRDARVAQTPAFERPEEIAAAQQTISSTKQLKWDGADVKKSFYQVDSPNTKIFTGFIQGKTFSYDDGTELKFGETLLDWATVSLTRVDTNRWLLAATGVMRNTDCKLGEYDPVEIKDTPNDQLETLFGKQISFCKTRGKAPLLCEGIPALVKFPAPESVVVKYYPLDGNGRRLQEMTAQRKDENFVEILLSPECKTLWYEIEVVK